MKANEVILGAIEGRNFIPEKIEPQIQAEWDRPVGWGLLSEITALRALLGDMGLCQAEITGFSVGPFRVFYALKGKPDGPSSDELRQLKERFGLAGLEPR